MDKRKKRILWRKRTRGVLTALFLIIVFLFWTIYYLLKSDLLNLKTINVYGNAILTEEEIIDVSDLYFNRNILQYDLKQIKSKVESHPYIDEANIKRKLPKTIIITVKEREKYAIIPYMGSFIYIDPYKVVLEVTRDYLAEDLVIITGVEFESFKLGEIINIHNENIFDHAMDLVEAARIISLMDMISEINIGREDYIKLITFDGIEVLLTKDLEAAYSMLTLREILSNVASFENKEIIIDMSYKGQISIKTKGNGNQWEESEWN